MSTNRKISNLPAVIGVNLQDTDILPLVASGVTSKTTIADLRVKLGFNVPAGGRTVTDPSTYFLNNALFNVKDFGAFGDDSHNDATAIQNAINAALAANGDVIFPPGIYRTGTQLLVTGPSDRRLNIFGYGAVIKNTTAASGLAITGRNSVGGVSVHGLTINHRANATATYGFEIYNATGTRLIDCSVEAHGVQAAYAGVLIRNGTAADDNTGAIWTEIRGIRISKRSGGDVGDIPVGILLHGQANATIIRGGNIGGTVTSGVVIEPEAGQTSLSNAVLIEGVAFEGLTNAIKINENNTSSCFGLRVINCRVESVTTFFNISGTSSNKSGSPTILANNYVANISVTNYISNTGSQYVNILDFAVSPNFITPYLRGAKGLAVAPLTVGEHAFRALASNNGSGYSLEDASGNAISSWVQRQFGGSSFKGGGNFAYLSQIASISGTSTEAKNLRGTVTVTGAATTGVVTFGAAEPDGTYFISVTPVSSTGTPAAGSNRVLSAAKIGASITVTVEAAPGVGNSVTFDWHLIR